MDVRFAVSIHLVGSKPPSPEWFAKLLRDAMTEYYESPRIREAAQTKKGIGAFTDEEIVMGRTVALQIATQLPRVEVAPDVGEAMIAYMTQR
jgi:hypothetical protein